MCSVVGKYTVVDQVLNGCRSNVNACCYLLIISIRVVLQTDYTLNSSVHFYHNFVSYLNGFKIDSASGVPNVVSTIGKSIMPRVEMCRDVIGSILTCEHVDIEHVDADVEICKQHSDEHLNGTENRR